MDTARKLVAEGIGTFFLCFAGIAAILSTQPPVSSGIGLVGVAVASGLALAIAVHVFGGISGAHVNPAVTIGVFVTGRIKLPLAVLYIVSQLVGAVLAAVVCHAIFPAAAVDAAKLGIPLPPPPPAGDWVTLPVLLLAEAVMTFLWVTAVFGTAVDPRGEAVKIGGFGIGLTLTFCILACGAVTGASLNPARSFGPALVYNDFELHWCYWVAPIVGGIVAGLLYQHVLLDDEEDQ